MITAIVLAAGTSSRMGSPKQLLLYHGRPLLRYVIDNLSRSKVDQIVVVLGHRHTETAAVLDGLPLKIIINKEYEFGQSSSVKAGLKALTGPDSVPAAGTTRKGVLFVLGDQPLLKPETINIIIDNFMLSGGIVAPFYQGVRGNPVLFDLSFEKEFQSLQGDTGAREIINRHPEALHKIEVTDPGILLDIDTPEDLERLSGRGGNKMPSNITFKKMQLGSNFLDPRQDFKPTTSEYQVRVDPLTGKTGHFSHFGAIKPQKLDLAKYNDPEIKGFCPFCGKLKTTVTPKFLPEIIPEGRLSKGEALLVPNIQPYDIYSSVLIMTDEHVVPLEKFSDKILSDSLSVGTDFLKSVKAVDPSLPYSIMTWNYMPPSGGGLVHPHQQYFTSATPGNQYTDEFKASQEFYNTYQTDFWSELIAVEEAKNERYLGQIGCSHWLTSFVSSGTLGEIMCIFPNVYSIEDFKSSEITDLVNGLQKVFRYFLDNEICSFNASLFWGPNDQKFFPAHLRIIPRTFMNMRDFAPDANFFQLLLGEPLSVIMPEDLCQEIKIYFEQK